MISGVRRPETDSELELRDVRNAHRCIIRNYLILS